MKQSDTSSSGGIFLSLLAVAFIVLKLTGVITWSWWIVLAPLWGPVALFAVGLIIVLLVLGVYNTLKKSS